MTKIAFQSPVTNAPFASLHRLIVGPVSLTTTPVPFRKKRARHERHRVVSKDRRASACGSPTVVSLRLRSCVSPPALHFPVRRTAGRSKTWQGNHVAKAMLKGQGVNVTNPGTSPVTRQMTTLPLANSIRCSRMKLLLLQSIPAIVFLPPKFLRAEFKSAVHHPSITEGQTVPVSSVRYEPD